MPRLLSRRLPAVGVAAVLVLAGLTVIARPAAADPAYDPRDAIVPVASYTFDDDSGSTVVDSSPRGNDGTWTGNPAYSAGVSGRALHISAGNNFVTLPRVPGQTDGSGSFSFETWWYDNAETADAPLVANQDFALCQNRGVTFYHLSGSYQQRSCFGINGAKTYTTTRPTSIRSGWHYLAVVEDSTARTYDYYVDGTRFSTTSTVSGSAAADFNSGNPLRIGQDGTGKYGATDDALVDDFNFYDQAISADQISADYAATNPATHFPVTVTDDGHGTGTASVLAPAAGAAVHLSAKPAPGYHLASWIPVTPATLAIDDDGNFVAPGTAVTVRATFAPNTYTVAYDGSGADSGTMTAQQLTYDQPATLEANAFTKNGDRFIGWSTSPDGAPTYTDRDTVQNLTTDNDGTVTLYAQWAPANSFLVTATGDEHVTVSASSDATAGRVVPGATVTLTATPAKGYSATWQVVSPTDLTIADDGTFTMPAQDVVVKSVSTPNRYTVNFDGNDATAGSTAAQSFTYDQPAALTANGFTRDGYGFLGWAISSTGPVAYTDGERVTNLSTTAGDTITLYAVWARLRAVGDTVAPVASYDFDADKGSTVSDGSGQGNQAAWKGTTTYATSFAGRAAHVSSGTNVVQLPKIAGETDGSGSFSFSTWWGEYGETSDQTLISNQDAVSCYNAGISLYHLSNSPTTRLCWGEPTGSGRQYSATSPTALTGHWHYLTVVVDRTAQTVSYYVDGKLFTTSSAAQVTANTKFDSGLPFFIGQSGTGTYPGSVDALVDDFDFYNQALGAAQIANDYQATKPADTTLPDESTVDIPTPISTVPDGFVTDTFHAPTVRVDGAVSQSVAGLWNGAAVTSYTKLSGDSWLDVDADGRVTGTAPRTAPQYPGTIVVRATDGTTTSTITVEVPVIAADDAPRIAATTWNLWDAGTHVDDSLAKELSVIASNGLDLIGVQEDGGTVAHQLAQALGWYDHEGADGLGIVSAWPIATSDVVAATEAAPAIGVSVDVAGTKVRVWSAALDESAYGPEQACSQSGATASKLVAAERSSTRYAQAQAIAGELASDVHAADTTPVLFLGDLASPSASDWTAATTDTHCNVGAVDWPVPAAITGAGLTDSYRAAHADPVTDPGLTWSPIESTNPTTGAPEPQDRIDYVDFAGGDLHLLGSNPLVAGWPSATDIADNAWTSDHAAVVSTFALGTPLPPVAAPTVTVDQTSLVYQVGHGPADVAALRDAIHPSADPADATISLDASGVDYGTVGYYTVLVTATKDGYVSDPVAVTVQVVPVVKVRLAHTSISLPGTAVDAATLLDGLGATLNVDGTTDVDLSKVDTGQTGTYPVTVLGTDDYGFTATAAASVTITSPDLPPVVTVAVNPAAADGTAGWYVSTPTVTAIAVDDSDPTPTLEYRRTTSGDWIAYPGPLQIPDGDWTYQFRATDGAGHVSDPVSLPIKVDKVAPTTTAVTKAGPNPAAPVTVTLTASDATSGVAGIEYRIGDGAWTAYAAPFTVTPRSTDQTISYRSTDRAGNVGATSQLVIHAVTRVTPTITATASAVPYGTAAKVTVTVRAPGVPVTGTVSLREGTTARGTATLTAGTARFTLPVGLAAGQHVLTVSYSGSDLVAAASTTVTVTVTLPPAWRSLAFYGVGAKVSYQGRVYVAAWFTLGQRPGDPYGPWQEIAMTENGTALWTASRIFQPGDVVCYQGSLFRARWYTRNQRPGDRFAPWGKIG